MALTDQEKRKIEEEERARVEARKKIEKESKGIGCGTILVGILVFGLLMMVVVGLIIKISPSTYNSTPTSMMSSGKIDVSREQIINTMVNYNFSQKETLNGQENYMAQNKAIKIQLLGLEDNLSSASITDILRESETTLEERMSGLTDMINFAKSIDPNASTWFAKTITNDHPIGDLKPYEVSNVISGRKLTVIFTPGDSLTLGITPAN